MPPTPFCSRKHNSLHQLLQWPVSDLAEALVIETQKFLAHEEFNDQIGLALFTLAISQKNEQAWTCLYQHYQPLVLTWIRQCPQVERIIVYDGDPTSIINRVFAKFFQGVTPAKLAGFETLAALLKYLRLCARSVVCDELRRHRERSCEDSLDGISEEDQVQDDPTERVLTALAAPQVWQTVLEELYNDEERFLVVSTYGAGMKPSEICRLAPRYFPTVEDVYRVKRNVLERLRRNKLLHDALLAA